MTSPTWLGYRQELPRQNVNRVKLEQIQTPSTRPRSLTPNQKHSKTPNPVSGMCCDLLFLQTFIDLGCQFQGLLALPWRAQPWLRQAWGRGGCAFPETLGLEAFAFARLGLLCSGSDAIGTYVVSCGTCTSRKRMLVGDWPPVTGSYILLYLSPCL